MKLCVRIDEKTVDICFCLMAKNKKTPTTHVVGVLINQVEIIGLEPITLTLPVSRSSQMS
jgi:hypothetical protein